MPLRRQSLGRKLPFGRVSAVLLLAWFAMAVRIGVAIGRHEPLSGDPALPLFLLFVLTTLLVNRVWFYFRPVEVEPSSQKRESR